MIQSDHRVGLAATEVGLEVDHGIAPVAAQPSSGPNQQLAQTVGEIGAPKERDRILVFVVRVAGGDLVQVSSELGLLKAAVP